ncbi:MAG: PAS domain S-box protein [Deltaproteobacteria bacterium]|nr:MAG: PAS domain S-box protein [Deltaproteobacteria bacterium]TMQ24204.1 MAG: PAS domain S-box protein [Deltaproteobacteria bacterium]
MVPNLGATLPALLDALGHVGIGVTIIADRGRGFERIYVNGPAAALLGYTVDEVQAHPLLDTIAPEQRELVTQLSASFRAGQPVPPALEFLAVRKDGSTLPVELALGSVRIPDGLAYVMVIRDVSLHQQTQLSLLEADRIGLVGALAAGFAHEINNPLTSILLNLRSLRRQLTAGLPFAAQPAAMRCVDDVNTGAERIASNVRALQTLATRSGIAPIDLAGVVSSALRLAAPSLEARAHVIRQIFPVRRVLGEESRIGQAVLAMLLFSSSGFDTEIANSSNRIVVSVEQRDDDVVLEVSDNGRDLTPEETLHAFDPFYRSSARGAGVGVGLGVARSVAATLGGEVTLAPRPEGGAVITMRLRAMPP